MLTITFNGQTYDIPQDGNEDWGPDLTAYFSAISTGALQKTGGSFTLTANVNFGATYGVLSKFFGGRSAAISNTGLVRLAVTDTISWRNNADDGNLSLGVNGSDLLTFNGSTFAAGGITALTGDVTASGPGSAVATITPGIIVNAMINASAAIAYSKLALTGAILNADISASAAIAYSKLALTGAILNADISASAAIAYSKLALTGAILNADINASAAIADTKLATISTAGKVSNSATTATTLSTASSIVLRDASGNFLANQITAFFIGNLSGNATTASTSTNFTGSLTGDVTSSGMATTIAANVVSNSKLATIATSTIKGRTTAGTGNVEDLTGAQVTALLSAADVSTQGVVTTGVQSFAGAKTFTGALVAPSLVLNTTPLAVTSGGTGVTTSTGTGAVVRTSGPTILSATLDGSFNGVIVIPAITPGLAFTSANNTSTGTINNLSFAATWIRFTTAATTITLNGIASGGADGAVLYLTNLTNNTLTINDNSGSATGKKIRNEGAAAKTVLTLGTARLIFDSASDVWRTI